MKRIINKLICKIFGHKWQVYDKLIGDVAYMDKSKTMTIKYDCQRCNMKHVNLHLLRTIHGYKITD